MLFTPSTCFVFALGLITSLSAHAQASVYLGGFSSALSLRWRSYADANYESTIMTPAANEWNGLSSKVSLVKNTYYSQIFVYNRPLNQPGVLGQTFPYYQSGSQYVMDNPPYTHTWSYVDVVGDDAEMSRYNMSTAQKIENYAHEFGHSLSLAHTGTVGDSNPPSIMKQGIQQTTPTTKDKSSLKARWEN